MKIILNIIILVINICTSENAVYDWHVRTIDRSDKDFDDDLKLQTALNNERQQDILKYSGQTNNKEFNANSFYNHFKKNIESKNNNNEDDAKENMKNRLSDRIDKNHEDKNDFQSIFDENIYYNQAKNFKKYDDYNNEDPQQIQTTYQNYLLDNHQMVLQKDDRDDRYNLTHSIDRNKQNPNSNPNANNGTYLKNDNIEKLAQIDFESFVGTNLFDSPDKKCFSSEDVALLAIRKDFESFIPKYLPDSLFDDRMVALLMNYFYICHQMVTGPSSVRSRHLVQKAFYDTLGGYFNYYMVPVAKYSFYAGQINLKTAKQVLLLHEESKKFLNTNGNGWKAPLQNVLLQFKSAQIEPLHISEIDDEVQGRPSFCMQLDMNTDENQPDNDKMIVQLPKIESENVKGYLGNIWLPFRRKRTFDLKLESSTNIVVKYYETVTKCYRFENIDQEFFDEQFKTWLMENIIIHLSDEQFYPGLGAVLRVFEFLKVARNQVIGIDRDLDVMDIVDEKFNKYRSYKVRQESMQKSNKIKHNKTKENHKDHKDAISHDIKKTGEENVEICKVDLEKEAKTHTFARIIPNKTKDFLRSLDLSPYQIVLIAITIIAVILLIIVCCLKCFCKKKKTQVQPKPIKNSSSSSSNLFNSPVRFFQIKKKSASNTSAVDYSSNENGNKKNKKSVKIDKKPLIKSELRSPNRNKKSKEGKGNGKDSDRSNSKSSWETTFSSK